MKEGKKNPTLLISIAAVICIGLGFFGGMKYQQTKVPTFARNGQNGMPGAMQDNNGKQNQTGTARNAKNGNEMGYGGMQLGTVTSIDDTSMTVKLQDGSSKIVILSKTTSYKATTDASKTDIAVGATVAVSGTANTDGSVSAQNVQVNPAMMGGPQNGNGPAGQ